MPASCEGHGQGAALRLAALVGQRHVERVAAHAVAGHLGVDVGAARQGVLELLEHEHAGALADHEPVALDVEGLGRALRMLVVGAQGARRREPGHADRADRRLAAAGEHDLGRAVADEARGVADGVGGRGAGRAGGAERTSGAELERDVRGAHVGDHHRDQQRVGAVRSLVEQLVRLDVQSLQAADTAGHDGADPLGLRAGVEVRVVGGIDRRGHRVAAEEVQPARLALVDVVLGDEALDLGGDVHLVAGGVEAGDLAHARLAGHEPAPEGVHVVADGRDDAQTGDDDSALLCHADSPAPQMPRPPSTGRVTPVTKRAAGEAR